MSFFPGLDAPVLNVPRRSFHTVIATAWQALRAYFKVFFTGFKVFWNRFRCLYDLADIKLGRLAIIRGLYWQSRHGQRIQTLIDRGPIGFEPTTAEHARLQLMAGCSSLQRQLLAPICDQIAERCAAVLAIDNRLVPRRAAQCLILSELRGLPRRQSSSFPCWEPSFPSTVSLYDRVLDDRPLLVAEVFFQSYNAERRSKGLPRISLPG